MLKEINFDGLIGPSHNYAGLSLGNLAATDNAGKISHPRAAALQGITKMRANIRLGLTQGILLPHHRPDHRWLATLSTDYHDAAPHLQALALSASSMWAANAATVSPAPDTGDGRCHLTVANLVTMPHRSHEWRETLAQLKLAFAHPDFVVHEPVPPPFGDEGAANHMRMSARHETPGVEIFVYGVAGGPFPARQHREASQAVARAHMLRADRTLFLAQSEAAIAAGAFHNDVVAVANGRVIFVHEQAFADRDGFTRQLRQMMPEADIVEVPAASVSLAEAVSSYLFNAQLVTLPDDDMALILPEEARANPRVWAWLNTMLQGNGPIRRLEVVNVRESMANGGGPACLRLRVVADPATVDPRFLVDEAKLDQIAGLIEREWPEQIDPETIADPALISAIGGARRSLLQLLEIVGLIDS